MAQRSSIYIDQGTDFSTTIDVFEDDGNEFDLSNYSYSGAIKKVYSSSIASNFIISPLDSNTLTVTLSGSASETLDPGKYIYDVVITNNSSGARTKILEGLAFILPTVTESA